MPRWPVPRAALRIAALDALTGLREVRAFGAEGRMLAVVQAREAALLATQHELAGRAALGRCRRVAVRPGGHPRRADRGGQRNPVAAVVAAFLVVAAFEAVGGLPRAGVLAGHAAAAAHRVLEAAEAPVPVPDPPQPAPGSGRFRAALRGGAVSAGSPTGRRCSTD